MIELRNQKDDALKYIIKASALLADFSTYNVTQVSRMATIGVFYMAESL